MSPLRRPPGRRKHRRQLAASEPEPAQSEPAAPPPAVYSEAVINRQNLFLKHGEEIDRMVDANPDMSEATALDIILEAKASAGALLPQVGA